MAGAGPVEARLQVWAGGQLALAQTVALNPGELWDAGTLACNPLSVDAVPGPKVISPW